jgi:hypothetical protein
VATDKFPLTKLGHEHGATVIDEFSKMEVFHAPTPHTLIQAAGYLKHTRAVKVGKGVFFRGQTRLYDSLSPTLLRGVRDGPPNVKRREALAELLLQIQTDRKALRAVDSFCHEPLLQHYGIRTTWLDVVDNIWVALWFACHHAKSLVRGSTEYLHFEKRIPTQISNGDTQYAYVLLLESAYFTPVDGRPGHYKDDRSETVDLRIAAPFPFVRPHAQHGILVRRLSNTGLPVSNCLPMHVGTIRVDLSAALDWLGNATTLTSHSLFPPAFYDYGYRELLDFVAPSRTDLGYIHRIQA